MDRLNWEVPMGHDHNHHHGSSNLKIAFIINLIFTIIEIIGGILTNSVAILSDAVHDLGDSISLLFSLIMERVSKKEGNKDLTFGYRRYSLLGAIFSAVVLIIGSTFVIYNAVTRIVTVEEVHAEGMLLMSIGGMIFNGLAVLRLKKDKGINSRVVFLHLLEDALGWFAIFIISIVMLFVNLPILDPILSIVIAVFVLSRIVPTFMKIGRIFMQYKPDDVEIDHIRSISNNIEEIVEIHDIHLWSLDGTNHVVSIHAVVNDGVDLSLYKSIKTKLRQEIEKLGIGHITIEMESYSESCNPCN